MIFLFFFSFSIIKQCQRYLKDSSHVKCSNKCPALNAQELKLCLLIPAVILLIQRRETTDEVILILQEALRNSGAQIPEEWENLKLGDVLQENMEVYFTASFPQQVDAIVFYQQVFSN